MVCFPGVGAKGRLRGSGERLVGDGLGGRERGVPAGSGGTGAGGRRGLSLRASVDDPQRRAVQHRSNPDRRDRELRRGAPLAHHRHAARVRRVGPAVPRQRGADRCGRHQLVWHHRRGGPARRAQHEELCRRMDGQHAEPLRNRGAGLTADLRTGRQPPAWLPNVASTSYTTNVSSNVSSSPWGPGRTR